ncbi:hypothetical protein ABT351_31430, partial [Micromonospora sp. NPDC000018]
SIATQSGRMLAVIDVSGSMKEKVANAGNAWRAELLFLAGLAPDARAVASATAHRLWDLAVRHLALGRDAGQVVSDPAAPDERWVYKRTTCRRCGASVRTWELGGRTAYACPVDQPAT